MLLSQDLQASRRDLPLVVAGQKMAVAGCYCEDVVEVFAVALRRCNGWQQALEKKSLEGQQKEEVCWVHGKMAVLRSHHSGGIGVCHRNHSGETEAYLRSLDEAVEEEEVLRILEKIVVHLHSPDEAEIAVHSPEEIAGEVFHTLGETAEGEALRIRLDEK